MKIITEIKKACCFNRFAFLVMSLGLIATFTACSSDNDSDIPVYSLKDVEGNYSGNMLTETAPSVNPQNYSFKEEQPQGATVTAEVKDNQIMIKKLPVDDLIKSIVGEEIGEIIIETLGDINYNIPYTAAFNDDSKGSILLQLKPEPLEIKYTIPTQVQTEGEEAPQITVKIRIVIPTPKLSPLIRDQISRTSFVLSPKSRIMAHRSTTLRSGYCILSICTLSAPGPKK